MTRLLKDIHYDLYLIGLMMLTLFSFIGPLQDYLMPLLVGIGFLFVLGGGSVFYVIPIPFFVQMSFSDLRDNVEITTIYTVIFTLLILADIVKNRRLSRRGHLTPTLLLLVLLSVLTHVNSPDWFTTFAGFMQVASVLGLYVYFLNTLEPGRDNVRHAAKLMMYIGLLVSLQMMYVIYESGELATTVIRTRTIDLGWENLNVIVYANLISVPLIAWLIHESKVKIFYMAFGMLSMVGILLTLSRSSVLTLAVFVGLLVPLMFVLSKQKGLLVLQGLLMITMVGLTLWFIEDRFELVTAYLEAIQSRELTYMDDRVALLQVAWDQLWAHPLLGSGGLYSSRIHLAEAGFGSLNYHNTMAQASTLGVLGLGAVVLLFAKKLELLLSSKSPFKWYAILLVLVTAFVNGTFQPMYFYTTYMVFLFLVIAAIEVDVPPLDEDAPLT